MTESKKTTNTKNSFDEEPTENAAGQPLPGTGSRYDKDGKKIDLGVQHGG